MSFLHKEPSGHVMHQQV